MLNYQRVNPIICHQDVNQIQSSLHAFAAIRSDGSVVTWGKMDDGGNSSAVSPVSESGNGWDRADADPMQHVGQGMMERELALCHTLSLLFGLY